MSELPASDESGPPVPVTPLRRQSSCSSADTVILSPASGSSSSKSETYVPDHWRPEVESCLQEQSLTESARNEMVRALVLQLFARSIKPTRIQCEAVARKLILKYPFLKDDLGNGYVS